MQFPVQEAETTPVTALPKVITCFQKRLAKLAQLQEELDKRIPEPPSATASPQQQEKFENSIHRKILFLHAGMQSIRFGFCSDGPLSFTTPFQVYMCSYNVYYMLSYGSLSVAFFFFFFLTASFKTYSCPLSLSLCLSFYMFCSASLNLCLPLCLSRSASLYTCV